MERSASWGPVSNVALQLEPRVRLPPFVHELLEGWTWHTAVRADDLVVLEVGYRGLDRRARAGEPVLLIGSRAGGLLAVQTQPQHVEEQAIFEERPLTDAEAAPDEWGDGKPKEKPPPPTADTIAAAWLSASSRLVFKVPPGRAVVLTVEGVLAAMQTLELNLHPAGRSARDEARLQPDRNVLGKAVRNAAKKGVSKRADPRARRKLGSVVRQGQAKKIGKSAREAAGAVRRRDRQALAKSVRPLREALLVPLRAPRDDETAIELPRRLVLSPNQHAAWTHETRARALGPATAHELWHTRLGVRRADGSVTEDDATRRSVRAVWARSGSVFGPSPRLGEPTAAPPGPDEDPAIPFAMPDRVPRDAAGNRILVPLDAADRWEIVHLSGEHNRRRLPQELKHSLKNGFDSFKGFKPTPAEIERLHLTALGGWLDLRGQWAPHEKWGSLSEWRHRATLGRDHLVRVVYEGVLLPWGHRAALVKVSERRLHHGLDGAPAFLRQQLFIVVRQPELKPAAAEGRPWERLLPFTRLRMRTLITPPLDAVGGGIDGEARNLFVPMVGGSPFPFGLRGTALDGGRVDWTGPAVMALFPGALEPDVVKAALKAFKGAQGEDGLAFGGARMPLAPVGSDGDTVLPVDRVRFDAVVPEDTAKDTAYKAFVEVADRLPGDDGLPPPCVPVFERVQAQVPVAKHFAGTMQAPWLRWDPAYAQHGFAETENAAAIFLNAAETPVALDFSSRGDRSGGLVQPSFRLQALSRKLGPVSGTGPLAKLKKEGTFDPKDFFGDGLDPLLFGVLHLSDLVATAGLKDELDAVPRFLADAATLAQTLTTGIAKIEQLVGNETVASVSAALTAYVNARGDAQLALARIALETQLVELAKKLPPEVPPGSDDPTVIQLRALLADAKSRAAVVDALRVAEELTLRFAWSPKLRKLGPFLPHREGTQRQATMSVNVVGKVKTRGGAPSFDVETKLEDFTLDLLRPVASFIELRFERLHFALHAGQKPDVICDLAEVRFVGVLSFVESLRSLIPLDGFDDPPALAVDEQGVRATYSLALPDIAFGVFSLRNLTLGAGFVVPFVATPLTARFSFCEREAPFLLTVSAFGGGGFLSICVDPGGVQALEAGFEFGASLAMNFVVASGEVHVMGGFVYAMVSTKAELTGYLRVGGAVEALGIVIVSVELTLALTYDETSGKCSGVATLEIEIDVPFFSIPIVLRCERSFAGANGDPPFAWMWGPTADLPPHITKELVPVDPWATYCAAFAPAT